MMTATSALAAALSGRGPILLVELDAHAAYLTRVDRKYIVTADAAARLVHALPAGTKALEIDGARTFGYRSTYYDTDALASYLAAARRRTRRYKVRSRTYTDSGWSFLEVKTRRGPATVKRRVPWEPAPGQLDGAAANYVATELAAECLAVVGALGPVLDVDYRRSTLVLPDASARITLDVDIEWRRHSSPVALRPGAIVIVETKSGSCPSDADRLLWRHGHRPSSVSKYATGLAALSPELPSNRWHRLLKSGLLADARH
jgi:VTC domain